MHKTVFPFTIPEKFNLWETIKLTMELEFINPVDFNVTNKKSKDYIPSKLRLMEEIELLGHWRRHAPPNTEQWTKANDVLLPKLAEFIGVDFNIANWNYLKPESVLISAVEEMAIRLAGFQLRYDLRDVASKSFSKNLNNKRAYYFDSVKEMSDVFHNYLVSLLTEIGPVNASLDYNRDWVIRILNPPARLTINDLKSYEPLRKFSETPTDKDIFLAAQRGLRKSSDKRLVQLMEDEMNILAVSNFKTIENSLFKGRRSITP